MIVAASLTFFDLVWLGCETGFTVTADLLTSGLFVSGSSVVLGLILDAVLGLPPLGAEVRLFAGRPGVGMLLATVALLVSGVSVGISLTGGGGVE